MTTHLELLRLANEVDALEKTAAISERDLWDAVDSARRAKAKVRSVKDSAWKKVLQMGYVKFEGFNAVVTPMGEVYMSGFSKHGPMH